MVITHRGGHNLACVGASDLIDEVVEDRKVQAAVVKYLKLAGHTLVDCTPPNMSDSNQELNYGINRANTLGKDLFFSIHFNASNRTTEARGTEVWTYPNDNFTRVVGTNICKNLEKLGFKNRGVKSTTGLAELALINYSSMIIEVCFVDSVTDVNLYHKVGADAIGKAIAEAIHGKPIIIDTGDKDLDDLRGKTAIVTADVLNVREKASTSSKILGQVYQGERLNLYRRYGDWVSISYKPYGAFVHADFIKIE